MQKCFTDNGRGNGHIVLNQYMTHLHMQPYQLGGAAAGSSRNFKTIIKDTLESVGRRAVLIGKVITHDRRKTTEQKADKTYALLEEMTSQSPWRMRTRNTTYTQQLEKVVGTGQDLFLQHIVGACGRVIELAQCIGSEQAAVLTIVAAARYEIGKGTYPDSLVELVDSGYLHAVPQDPYSDVPLVYRNTDEGFTLYSVGEDFTDDGGKKHQWLSGHRGEDYIYWPVPVRSQEEP